MRCTIHPLGSFPQHRYVVVLSHMAEGILLSRHRARSTWETQGGHIEPGETPLMAAERELYEESGAAEYTLRPLCEYWAGDDAGGACGVVYTARIARLGPLPQSEMAETRVFDALPHNLTYPAITPSLFAYEKEMKQDDPS